MIDCSCSVVALTTSYFSGNTTPWREVKATIGQLSFCRNETPVPVMSRWRASASAARVGLEQRELVEAGASGSRPSAAGAFPGVETDVVVVADGGEKGRARSEAVGDLEPENA